MSLRAQSRFQVTRKCPRLNRLLRGDACGDVPGIAQNTPQYEMLYHSQLSLNNLFKMLPFHVRWCYQTSLAIHVFSCVIVRLVFSTKHEVIDFSSESSNIDCHGKRAEC